MNQSELPKKYRVQDTYFTHVSQAQLFALGVAKTTWKVQWVQEQHTDCTWYNRVQVYPGGRMVDYQDHILKRQIRVREREKELNNE